MDQPLTSNRGGTDTGSYEIRVQGHVDARRAAWFDGMSVDPKDDGTTVIRGAVADQAALHGLLQRVRDLGIPLVAVERTDTDAPRSDARTA